MTSSYINEPKMAFGLWPLRCSCLHCRLRLVSSKSSWLQIQIFTHPVIFKVAQTSRSLAMLSLPVFPSLRNHTQHLLALDKLGPCGYRTSSCYCPWESSDPETVHHTCTWHHLHMLAPSLWEFSCLSPSGWWLLPLILRQPHAGRDFSSPAALCKHPPM